MKTQTLVATTAAVALLLGAGAYLIVHSKARAAVSPGEVVPIRLANDSFTTHPDDRFLVDLDATMLRTTNSAPAGHIKSLVEPGSSGATDFLASLNGKNFAPTLYGTGELWCDDFQIDIVSADTPITDDRIWHVWSENSNDYTEWTQRTIMCRIPKETQCLDTGFAFFGSGKVWIDMDSLKYEIAD